MLRDEKMLGWTIFSCVLSGISTGASLAVMLCLVKVLKGLSDGKLEVYHDKIVVIPSSQHGGEHSVVLRPEDLPSMNHYVMNPQPHYTPYGPAWGSDFKVVENNQFKNKGGDKC